MQNFKTANNLLPWQQVEHLYTHKPKILYYLVNNEKQYSNSKIFTNITNFLLLSFKDRQTDLLNQETLPLM